MLSVLLFPLLALGQHQRKPRRHLRGAKNSRRRPHQADVVGEAPK
jgi:hypothetical protein